MVLYNQRQELLPPISNQAREVIGMFRQYRPLLLVVAVAAVVLILGSWPRYHATHAQKPAGPTPTIPTIRWEPLGQISAPFGMKTFRAAVPGGWLVCVHERKEETRVGKDRSGHGIGVGAGVTFVPDPLHEWK
jgi:hypothetical protein